GRARERPLSHRRALPGMGVCDLGRPGLHHLARVQEDPHGRVDRPGGHRRARGFQGRVGERGGRRPRRLPPTNAVDAPRRLPPVAAKVDEALVELDAEIDWLLALNPVGVDELWTGFEASGRKTLPPLRYLDRHVDLHAARERLLALPVEEIESPL